jgi:DnaJ-class molecular chaperone
MTADTKDKQTDCEACFGTGNANSSMQPSHPTRHNNPYVDCPDCKGTGKKPKAS